MEATSGVLDGLVSLPEGGGSVTGLGERFQPDLLKGTGNYSVPIELPKNPAGPTPDVSLEYSTGRGNGPFGLGWSLSGTMEIRRRTDDGVPAYDGTDQFILAGAGVLVEVEDGRYRPRTDRKGWDVRRTDDGWRIRTKEGEEYLLGTTEESRVADGDRVFAWLVDEHRDPAGNAVTYSYERHGTAVYLSSIEWGVYSLEFEYESRPDPVNFGRAGFRVRRARRCRRIEHRCGAVEDPLVARYDLVYEQAEGSGLSMLTEIHKTGHDGDETESRPPITLSYSRPDPEDADLVRVESDDRLPSLADENATLVDMTGDGLPDVLRTGPGDHELWPNRGDGSFGTRRSLSTDPPAVELGEPGVSLGDLNGDGTVDIFSVDGAIGTSVPNTGAGAWADRPTVYAQEVPLALSASDSRVADLDGDGVVDLLQSGFGGFRMVYNEDGEGWSRPAAVTGEHGGESIPGRRLHEPGVRVADVTGDGLSDVVFVDDGRVEYWPHYGRGNWGEKVRMENPPSFPDGFDRDRLFAADLDRDGTADLVYVDADSVYCWFNQSGERFSDRYEVPNVPFAESGSLHVADLAGEGTQGLAWSGGVHRDRADTGYRYLQLDGDGPKPYLLTEIDNGTGLVTEISYTTTTALRNTDREEGQPWETFLPFPLHVVEEYALTDRTTGRTRRTELDYERGSYDGRDGTFRGFERVAMTIHGDDHTPTARQEVVFEQPATGTGLADDRTAQRRARDRALAGRLSETRTYEVADDGSRGLRKRASVDWRARQEFADGGRFVHFPHVDGMETVHHSPDGPDRIESTDYTYDRYGNVTRRMRRSRFSDEDPSEALVTERTVTYTENEAEWLVGLPASAEVRDGDGTLLEHTRRFYDGPAFEGLPEGEATQGVLRRVRELVLADERLPEGYADEIDPAWGLVQDGEGFYRDKQAYDHDDRGQPVAIRDELGLERTVAYDEHGFPDSLTQTGAEGSERGVSVDFEYRTGQPAAVRLADDREIRYRYSPLGRLLAREETTGDGDVEPTQLFTVDFGDPDASPPRPSSVTSLKPRSTTKSTAEILAADPATLDGVDVSRDFYDGEGNRLQQVRTGPDAADGSRRWVAAQRTRYTVRGDRAREFPNTFVPSLSYHPDLPTDRATEYRYTVDGEVRRTVDDEGRTLRVDRYPDRVEKRTPGVGSDEPPVVHRLDARGNQVAVEEPTGDGSVATTRYEVDHEGRITEITDASGRVLANYVRAGPGDPVRVEHADAGTRTFWRDAAGEVRLRTDSLGRRLEIDRDERGRTVAAVDATDPENPETVRELTYEGSRLVSARDGDVTVRFEHNAAGRRTKKTVEYADGEERSIEREFTRQGKLAALTYPDGTAVTIDRDDTGSRVGVSGFVESVRYDELGNPLTIQYPGGTTAEYDHEAGRDWLRRAALVDPDGTTLRETAYEYDEGGNVTSLRDEFPGATTTREFSYDRRFRLTDAEYYEGEPTGDPRRNDGYEYTATGDLVRNGESFDGPMEYGDPDHAGRLTAIHRPSEDDPTTLSYDAAGRVTGYGDLEDLSYDVFGRLVEVTTADGRTVRFEYTADGDRVETAVTEDGSTRRTRSVGGLYESGPDGERLWVRLDDTVIAATRVNPADGASRTAYLLADHQGSIIAAADGSGSLVGHQVYSPYGKPLRSPASAALERYIGIGTDDPTGLKRFGDRYYSPELGRFLTPDWYVIEDPSAARGYPLALSAYGYAAGNPVRFSDPSGKLAFLTALGIAAAATFVVGMVAGTAAGRAQGESWGQSLLRGLEAGLLGAAGMALGFVTGGIAGFAIGGLFSAGLGGFGTALAGGLLGGVIGGAIGGINGIVSGANQIYSADAAGVFSFIADSTWGLVGTTLGLILHTVNLFYPNRRYRAGVSHRSNAHVYDGGFGFGNFAFTQGNVISNMEGRRGALLRHERQHVMTSRVFGPIFQATYVAWLVVGAVAGFAIGLFGGNGGAGFGGLGQDIEDVAYYNNPWETVAYNTEGPPNPGDGALSWV